MANHRLIKMSSLRMLASPFTRLLGVRAFAVTPVRCAVSPYTIFMKQTAKHPKLQGLPIEKRGRKLASMYRALSSAEKSRLAAAGAKAPTPKRRVPKPRKPNAWAKFVRANHSKVANLPFKKRLSALFKLYGKK